MGILLIVIVTILKVILGIFLALLTLLLLVLILPVSYNCYLEFDGKASGRARIGWPWQIIVFDMDIGNNEKGEEKDEVKKEIEDEPANFVYIFGIKAIRIEKKPKVVKVKEKGKKKKEKAEEETGETEKEKSIFTIKYVRELIGMGVLRDLFEFVERFLRLILPRRIEISMNYGFEDPSITGSVHGAYCSVPSLRERWNIYLYPNFVEEEFRVNGFLQGHFQLVFIIILVIRLYFKKAIRKLIKDIRRSRKDGKQKSGNGESRLSV